MLRHISLSFKFSIIFALSFNLVYADDNARETIIKKAILENGFQPSIELFIDKDASLVPEGEVFFNSEHLSLNGNVSCSTCHFPEKSSGDGISNAAGVGGHGEGYERLMSGAKVVPRNSLALWGIGSKGLDTMFWDGKLDFSGGKKMSQFGTTSPSNDALITAIHLPAVEIRETLEEDAFVIQNKSETVEGADVIYNAIADNLKVHESIAVNSLANKIKKKPTDITFLDVAKSIAAFIRSEFRIKETLLERFVSGNDEFNNIQLLGAEIFYGKGGCSICHSGSVFSDLNFYTVPFPQLGFGKNGFGIDYGRYNSTFNPKDLYKFRTPLLYNVEYTAPYGHSGSVMTLNDAIKAHYDPLSITPLENYDELQRHEFYKFLAKSDVPNTVNFLREEEVDALVEFLRTLSFK